MSDVGNVTVFHSGASTAAWGYTYEDVAPGTEFYVEDGNGNDQRSLWVSTGAVTSNLSRYDNANLYTTTGGTFTFYVAQGIYSYGTWAYGVANTHSNTMALKGDRDNWAAYFGTFDSDNSQLSVHLDEGEIFKFVYNQNDWYGYDALSNPGSNFGGSDSSNITVNVSGDYVFTIPSSFSGSGITYTVTADVSDGAYLRGDWTDGWTEDGQVAATVVTADTSYKIENVVLSDGGTVKMIVMSSGLISWCQPNNVTSTDSEHYPVSMPDDGKGGHNVQVTNAGTYTITITKNGDNWDYEFEGTSNPNLEAAIAFVDGFKTGMAAKCPINAETGSESNLTSEWNTTQAGAYAALDPAAQAYLTAATTTVTKISEFWERYEDIYDRYHTKLGLTDFLGRYSDGSRMMTSNTNNNNYTPVIIIIISSVAVVSLLGAGLMIKRRKENR